MKGQKLALSTTLPNALLPDPDSLLHHIDRAVVSTEYARASQSLANVPPGPHIFSIPSPICPPTSDAISREEGSPNRKGWSLLRSSWVEEFLNKVTMGEGRESSQHGANSATTVDNGTRQPQARSSSGSSGLQPHRSVVKNRDSLANLETRATKLESVNTSSDLQPLSVDLLKETIAELKSNSTALQRLAGGVVTPKFSNCKSLGSNSKNSFASPRVQSNDEFQVSGASNPHLSSNSTGSSPRIAGSNEWKGAHVTDEVGQQSELDRKYDAAAADEAYRAGRAAMEEGDMVQAISLLRLASIKCPPGKTSAILKIEKLMTAAAHELEMQEASRNISERVVPAAEQEPSTAEVALGRQLPMKILIVGNMLKADEAYRAGVAAVEAGQPGKALQHLRKAALACPDDRQTAAGKIQTLVEQANFELRML